MFRVPVVALTSRLMVWAAVRFAVKLMTSPAKFPGIPPVQLPLVFHVSGPAPV